jgi:large subunit ribosomal protein L29
MKMKELRELNKEELLQKLDEMKEEMFNLRFQKAMNRLENSMRIKVIKKDIVRIKTLITEIDNNSKNREDK